MPAANEVLAVEFDHYGGPEVLQLRRIAPPQPGPDEVLIDVHAASMNPVDWKVRSGMLQKFFPVTFPAITGRDGAGEVIAVGSGADASLLGKRVCFLASRGVGTWSQKIALPAALAVPFPATFPIRTRPHCRSRASVPGSAWCRPETSKPECGF